jgi:hypothetical protein
VFSAMPCFPHVFLSCRGWFRWQEQHPSGSYTFILAGHRQPDSSSWLFIKVTYKQLNRIGSPR